MANTKLQNRLTILIGTIVSCFIGFYNGYPLIYPDTGAYLASGFDGTVPWDRTIFYGLFIRHISLSASPWLIIIAQGFIISWLLHLTTGIFFKNLKRNLIYLLSVTLVTLTTGFSFNVSIIIPDIFSPIALLCLIILIFHHELGKIRRIIISIIFLFSICTHLSNIPTFAILLFCLIGYVYIKKLRKKESFISLKRILLPTYLFFFSLLLIPSVNYLHGDNFGYSKGSHVFMMNHLIECGVMDQYLEHNCKTSDYTLCEYENNLGTNFIWGAESPLHKTGGWKTTKEEYNKIIADVYSSPRYWPLIIQKGIEYTFKQFFSFDIGDPKPHLEGSAPYGQIHWRFHDSLREYKNSKQNKSLLSVSAFDFIQLWIILISMLSLFILISFSNFKKLIPLELRWMIITVFIYSLANAAICSNLSTVDPRYQNRLVWLFPILVIFSLSFVLKKGNLKRLKNDLAS